MAILSPRVTSFLYLSPGDSRKNQTRQNRRENGGSRQKKRGTAVNPNDARESCILGLHPFRPMMVMVAVIYLPLRIWRGGRSITAETAQSFINRVGGLWCSGAGFPADSNCTPLARFGTGAGRYFTPIFRARSAFQVRACFEKNSSG